MVVWESPASLLGTWAGPEHLSVSKPSQSKKILQAIDSVHDGLGSDTLTVTVSRCQRSHCKSSCHHGDTVSRRLGIIDGQPAELALRHSVRKQVQESTISVRVQFVPGGGPRNAPKFTG